MFAPSVLCEEIEEEYIPTCFLLAAIGTITILPHKYPFSANCHLNLVDAQVNYYRKVLYQKLPFFGEIIHPKHWKGWLWCHLATYENRGTTANLAVPVGTVRLGRPIT